MMLGKVRLLVIRCESGMLRLSQLANRRHDIAVVGDRSRLSAAVDFPRRFFVRRFDWVASKSF